MILDGHENWTHSSLLMPCDWRSTWEAEDFSRIRCYTCFENWTHSSLSMRRCDRQGVRRAEDVTRPLLRMPTWYWIDSENWTHTSLPMRRYDRQSFWKAKDFARSRLRMPTWCCLDSENWTHSNLQMQGCDRQSVWRADDVTCPRSRAPMLCWISPVAWIHSVLQRNDQVSHCLEKWRVRLWRAHFCVSPEHIGQTLRIEMPQLWNGLMG